MTRKIEISDDLKLELAPNAGNKKLQISSTLLDDLPKTPDDAAFEARKTVWANWINANPMLAAYLDDFGESYLFFLSEDILNKVVLIEISDYSLLCCRRSLDYVREWHRRYSPAGLVVISVHSPLFEWGGERKYVEETLKTLKIDFPVVMDNDFTIWRSLKNQAWPRRLLFDQKGNVFQDYIGEGGYVEFEQSIQYLLRQMSPGLSCPLLIDPIHPSDKQDHTEKEYTPEVFLGTQKKMRVGNEQQPTDDNPAVIFKYNKADTSNAGVPYFEGLWYIAAQSVYGTLQTVGSKPVAYYGDMRFHIDFVGTDIYIVARTRPKTPGDVPQNVRLEPFVDGDTLPDKNFGRDIGTNEVWPNTLIVRGPGLYHVATKLEHKLHSLSLHVDNEGTDTVELYAVFFDAVHER